MQSDAYATGCLDCASQPRQIFRKKVVKATVWPTKTDFLSTELIGLVQLWNCNLFASILSRDAEICAFLWELTKIIAQSFNLCKPTGCVSSNFSYLNWKKNIMVSTDDQRQKSYLHVHPSHSLVHYTHWSFTYWSKYHMVLNISM